MANTLFGAVKAYLEAQGLGISVFKDVPPTGAARPYVVFTGDISLRLEPLEDGVATTGSEEIQLDLYETWRGSDDKLAESVTLADAITEKVQGTSLPPYGTAKKQVYGLLQRNRTRILDRNARVVRHFYQIDALRQV